jgi:hypothetical protein
MDQDRFQGGSQDVGLGAVGGALDPAGGHDPLFSPLRLVENGADGIGADLDAEKHFFQDGCHIKILNPVPPLAASVSRWTMAVNTVRTSLYSVVA